MAKKSDTAGDIVKGFLVGALIEVVLGVAVGVAFNKLSGGKGLLS
jgi:hypothetical protein